MEAHEKCKLMPIWDRYPHDHLPFVYLPIIQIKCSRHKYCYLFGRLVQFSRCCFVYEQHTAVGVCVCVRLAVVVAGCFRFSIFSYYFI